MFLIIWFSASIYLIVAGVYKQYKHYKKKNLDGFQETTGYVVDYKRNERYNIEYDRLQVTFSSIIEYEVNGNKYRLVRDVSSSFKQKLGKKIRVMYNPNIPTDSIIKNDFSAIVVIIGGIFLFIIGVIMFIKMLVN